jgi:hypothetical protein
MVIAISHKRACSTRFRENVTVIAVQPDRKYKLAQIRELAPLCFSPAELLKERVDTSKD